MARTRNIKPGFFMNDTLAEFDPLCRLLFIGLWTIADREGRLKDNPKRIKAEILPYDDCDVEQFLDDLHRCNFIQRYTAEGKVYIQIQKFDRHQNPHKNEPHSIIPKPKECSDTNECEVVPEEYGTSTVQVPEEYSSNREGIKVKGIKVKDSPDSEKTPESNVSDSTLVEKPKDPIPYDDIIAIWNEFADKWSKPTVVKWTKARRKKIKRIYHMKGIRDFSKLETWREFYQWIENTSKFLVDECNWGFDGMHIEENFIKIIEGTYLDKKKAYR